MVRFLSLRHDVSEVDVHDPIYPRCYPATARPEKKNTFRKMAHTVPSLLSIHHSPEAMPEESKARSQGDVDHWGIDRHYLHCAPSWVSHVTEELDSHVCKHRPERAVSVTCCELFSLAVVARYVSLCWPKMYTHATARLSTSLLVHMFHALMAARIS